MRSASISWRLPSYVVSASAAIALQGCALSPQPSISARVNTVSIPTDTAVQKKSKAVQVGKASWYGPRFHGKKTASGELFDQHGHTAAHPSLPLGSRVRVTRLDNEKSVEVEVNDRGPFVDGRIIDLSRAAAEALGMTEDGVVMVRVEVLSERQPPETASP